MKRPTNTLCLCFGTRWLAPHLSFEGPILLMNPTVLGTEMCPFKMSLSTSIPTLAGPSFYSSKCALPPLFFSHVFFCVNLFFHSHVTLLQYSFGYCGVYAVSGSPCPQRQHLLVPDDSKCALQADFANAEQGFEHFGPQEGVFACTSYPCFDLTMMCADCRPSFFLWCRSCPDAGSPWA